MTATIAAILTHVGDAGEGLSWYQRAFPQAKRIRIEDANFECLKIGNIQLEIVTADEKVAAGAAGTVIYWSVDDLDTAIAHFATIGAALYRGPMQIEDGQWMCQVRDPWGNCIGLRGLRHAM